MKLLLEVAPDEICHLAAQSHVRVSFDMSEYTGDVSGMGAIRVLEAVRASGISTRFYQASSSEMFGSAPPPQTELTPFHPWSPYACAKVYGYHCTVNYREAFGLFAVNGIMFNHESPRRGETFVTRKVTRAVARAVARIVRGLQDVVYLGNLDARRDWGYAPEYVDAMWRMMQRDEPDDFVVATGESHCVREFCEAAFSRVGLDWERYVRFDARYERPSEVDDLVGDPRKAERVLGWRANVRMAELANIMVDADLRQLDDELSGRTVRIDR